MYKIYKIEDINDLTYYGKTKNSMTKRFCNHICEYRNHNGICSSHKLNLYNSIYTIVEDNLTEDEAIHREIYYIQNNDCVNKIKYDMNNKKSHDKYRSKSENRKTESDGSKLWYEKNKEKQILRQRERNKIDWFCNVCNCNIKLTCRSRHLKSKKHIKHLLK